jgi:hypothetical protein
MLQPNTPSRYVKGIEYTTVSRLLTHFRETIEREAGPIQDFDLNGALFLSDLCTFLGFNDELRDRVLGKSAAVWVHSVEHEPITLPTKH